MKSLNKYISQVKTLHSLNEFIQEKLIINKDYKTIYNYEPKTVDKLKKIIEQRYEEHGPGTEKNSIDFNDVDVSNIDSFYDGSSGIFEGTKFEYIDISEWDVSKVEYMGFMFYKCTQLKSVGDLSNWNVSKVENMNRMFYECENLESVGDLSNWDVSNVKNMRNMFAWCDTLMSIGDLSKWNVSNVKKMNSMFFNCEKLKSIGDLSNWDVSNVKNMNLMFMDSGIINTPDWYKEII